MADPTWLRHTIGSARTLTFGAARLEASDTPGWLRLYPPTGEAMIRHEAALADDCAALHLPAPTPEDLAWVRGGEMSLFPATSGAIFGEPGDETSPYRYALWRQWSPGPTMAVIGCNPSTATATEDDPTIRRCIRFALDSGHGRLVMLNCFAYRATDVRALALATAPLGEQSEPLWFTGIGTNMDHIRRESAKAATVVCAWGSQAKFPKLWRGAGTMVAEQLRRDGIPLHVFRLTKAGDPEHPLYLPASCRPTLWSQP